MFKNLAEYVVTPRYRAAGLTFFLMSVLFAFWVTRLPFVRDTLNLSEGEIGLALFFIPMGALAAMSVSHGINRKFGEGRVMTTGIILLSVAAIFPVVVINYAMLCLSLFFFGFFMGVTDISMNAVVSMFEQKDNVQIMSTSHGFFSLGGMIGAPLGSYFAGMNVSPLWQMLVTCGLIGLTVKLFISPFTHGFRDDHGERNESVFAMPHGALIPLAILSFCTMMGEGSVADWSAIYMKDIAGAPDHLIGFGYAAFSFSMTIGRFSGDSLSEKYGTKQLLLTGLIISVAGFLLTLPGDFYISLLGFILIGAGFSSVIPGLFRTAGRVEGYTSSYGIAAVASTGYTGFLIGPVLIGFIAEYHGLRAGFILLILLISAALVLARLRFPSE